MTPDQEMAVHAEEYDERGSMALLGMSLCAFSGFIVGFFAGWWI